jgi:hypothetical protein
MKIVTAIYELFKGHGLGHYRAVEAAYIRAFRFLPCNTEIQYVLYTDVELWAKYNGDFMKATENKNVTIKFFNLSHSQYKPAINAIKERLSSIDADYYEKIDKHSAVDNYAELMLEKFNMVNDNIDLEKDDQVFWMDAGLFLNSCNFPWREWIGENCSKPEFFEKLKSFTDKDFILFQSTQMPHVSTHMWALRGIIPDAKGSDLIVSGGLWGGDAQKTKDITQQMAHDCHTLIDQGFNISDQEVLTLNVMRSPEAFKILNFTDWYDYQKVFLEIYGKYDPETYDKNSFTL